MTNITTTKPHQLEKVIVLNPMQETPVPLSPELGTNEMQIVRANRCYPKAFECHQDNFKIALIASISSFTDGYSVPLIF